MKKIISLLLAFALLVTLAVSAWRTPSLAAEVKHDPSVFVDGVYTLALAAEGSAADYEDGSVRRVLDMSMPGSSQSLLELNRYTGESSQQFIIRKYSSDSEYYMIQSINNQGYLGYNGFGGKKAEVKRYGQIDNNAEEYLWKPIANSDGSWSFAPMNAYTATDLTAWNLRLGVTDTNRGSAGTLAALVPTEADSLLQRWFLQPCNILTDAEETAFQIIVSQEVSGKTYATDNIGGTIRGAWDGLSTNLSVHNPNSKSQKFLFERVEPETLQAYQTGSDYRSAVAQSGGGYYSIREISNSEYLSVGTDGKLILTKALTDGGLWTVFPNWSQNNQSEAAIADSYSLVSYANGKYYSVSTQLTSGNLGNVNTEGKLEARDYAYDETNPFRQYWKLAEAARNPGALADGGTDLADGSFGTEALSLPIKLYDFASDNMLFEFDSYWPNYGDLLIGSDSWRKGTNPAFSLWGQGTAVTGTDLSAYDALNYRLYGTQTGGCLGLVEHSLNDRLPTYRQEVVEALAMTLQETLAIPYRNADNSINNTYLSGETDGARYGYENGEARDLAQWLRATITTDGSGAYVLGSYEETAQKRGSLLTAWDTAKGNISTCMDGAYFLLNSLFVPDSYNEYQPDYQYLALGKAVNAEGQTCYVFDSAFADENQESSVVYENQTISNASAATRPLYNGSAKYPFLPITEKNNETGMTKYESPLYESLRSLEQYGQTYYCRNYSFALASNSRFVYHEAEDQFFTFAGNDDAYLFLNGELVMDMGGTHSGAEATIHLNDYVRAARERVAEAKAAGVEPDARDAALALEEGKAYSFDFYYLQRMGPEANLRMETNIVVGALPELAFQSASLTLSSDLAINYYVADGTLEGWEEPYVVFTKEKYDAEGNITGYETQTVTDFSRKDGCHVYTFSGISAKEMGSTVTATLYATGNGALANSETVNYSVLTYAMNQLQNSTDTKLHTLLVDLLNYGAQAQTYWSYNTANLVNAGLTPDQQALSTKDAPALESHRAVTRQEGATVHFRSASLSLREKVTINYYLDLTDYAGDRNDLQVVITYVDTDGVPQTAYIDGSALVQRNGSYCGVFSELNPAQMRTVCTAEVFSKTTGERVSDTVTYSIESYAADKAGGEDTSLAELVIAMMKYGDSTCAFFSE